MQNILLVDNDTLSRESLLSFIAQIDSGTLIHECNCINDASKLSLTYKTIDIIIIKLLNIADAHYKALQILKSRFQDAKILIITNLKCFPKVKLHNVSGSIRVIAKDISRIRILHSIKDILSSKTNSQKYLATSNASSSSGAYSRRQNLPHKQCQQKLTCRQIEVIDYIVKGCSNKEIAYELGISEGTIKLHVSSILKILNVTNRTQAALEYCKSDSDG